MNGEEDTSQVIAKWHDDVWVTKNPQRYISNLIFP